jgi:hypothetical protein
MTQGKSKIDESSVTWATTFAAEGAERHIRSSLEYMRDERKKERKVASECKFCFYFRTERIGGAAMTTRDCGICEMPQMYGSTNTDKICKKCATENELCKYCGADVSLRPRRKYVPKVSPTIAEVGSEEIHDL